MRRADASADARSDNLHWPLPDIHTAELQREYPNVEKPRLRHVRNQAGQRRGKYLAAAETNSRRPKPTRHGFASVIFLVFCVSTAIGSVSLLDRRISSRKV
jgi:hypothetical protein